LLVHPRYLPYNVVAAIADDTSAMRDHAAIAGGA